jgi:hypothetical protein
MPLKIQINSRKPGIGRKNQLRKRGSTWANGTGHTSLPLKPLAKGMKIRVAPFTNFMFGDSIFGSLATMFGQ